MHLFELLNALWGSDAFPAFCSKCRMSWEHKHRELLPFFSTNAFYPMTSQDTMRPFCLFSQIRVRSHTNTNINILSSEWATKYLVGNSHESVFARFVILIYCEASRTALHYTASLLTRDMEKSVCAVIKCIGLVGHRWEQGCSCPKLECAVAAYKCHKIPWLGPKEQGVSVFLIVCHLFGSFRAEMKCTYLRQSNWQNYFIAKFQQELFMLLGICAAFGCLIPNTRWTWKRSGSSSSPW